MTDAKRRTLLALLKLFDIAVVVLSSGLSATLVMYSEHSFPLAEFFSIRIKLSNFVIFTVILLGCHLVFSMFGLYESRRLSTKRAESLDAFKATTVSTICLMLMAAIFSIALMMPLFLVSFWVISSTLICGCRLLLRYWLAGVRSRGRNLRNMLILGTNSRAVEFARRIERKQERGYRVLGFVDDDWPEIGEFKKTEFTLACDYAGLAEFLRRNVVDEVMIYLPLGSFYEHSSRVAALCEQHGILMRFDSDIFGLKSARAHVEEFDGDYHIATYHGVRDGWPLTIKRALDVMLSLIPLVMLFPLFVIVAVLIKLSSKGPVFFIQERVGLNKHKFRIYKFRTMVQNAEQMMAQLEQQNEVSGPVFKIKKDPRITPIGRFLRSTSIDELPQLFNVLKGDMSLVGPRPLPLRDYEGFSDDWQRRRFSVRPGITCLWQVNGRSSIPFEQWMKLDLQYMDEWSLWLDLKILARTIPAVLKGSGAA